MHEINANLIRLRQNHRIATTPFNARRAPEMTQFAHKKSPDENW